MKQWLKNKLRKFLEIDNIEFDLKQYQNKFNNHEVSNQSQINLLINQITSNHKYLKSNIAHLQDSISVLHNTVENVVHIGTDVQRDNYGHSWAVVCVEGKMNMVKFINLNRKDARYIFDFLKQFEGGRHCIDAFPDKIFYDGLFKF